MWEGLMIALGVMGLWIGTEFAVRAGGELGRRLGVSELFLGLTVFAIGTDISELVVSIQAATRLAAGNATSGLILGNALGSVLAQGGLVLGVLAFLQGLDDVERDPTAKRSAVIWVVATGLVALVAHDGTLARGEGLFLLAGYAAYFFLMARGLATRRRPKEESGSPLAAAGLVVGLLSGLALVVASADLAVSHSITLAEKQGVHPTAIGLFAIGAGTSMPELAVSIGAVARGRPALSLGNIVGSNIFDLLVPIGLASTIHPLSVDRNALLFDLPAIGILAVYLAYRLLRSEPLDFRDAIRLVGFYVAFVLFRLGTFLG